MKQKIYYKESRWLYLAFILMIIITYVIKDLNIMTALAILIFVPSIIMNELKPKRSTQKLKHMKED